MTLVQCKGENVRANKDHPALDKNEPLHVYGAMPVFKVDGLAREAAKCKGNCSKQEQSGSSVACPGFVRGSVCKVDAAGPSWKSGCTSTFQHPPDSKI